MRSWVVFVFAASDVRDGLGYPVGTWVVCPPTVHPPWFEVVRRPLIAWGTCHSLTISSLAAFRNKVDRWSCLHDDLRNSPERNGMCCTMIGPVPIFQSAAVAANRPDDFEGGAATVRLAVAWVTPSAISAIRIASIAS